MTARLRRLRVLAALLLGSVLLSGCDFDVYSFPLPGGADVGDDPITVTVEFEDVLDLVPRSAVKYNEVNVGQVTEVDLGGADGRTALVTIQLQNDTGLPDNATASIRQTSLLGEKFVSLDRPAAEAPADRPLATGDTIPLARTGRNPEVEEVLGALSLILNGGGVAQLKTIANEVNVALEGREDVAKSVLTQVNDLVTQLDDRKSDIVRAMRALNRLSEGVREQQDSIDRALDELPSAVTSLDRQRKDLVRMLRSLDRLSDVGVRVIDQTKEVTLGSLRQLLPVLTQLAASGDSLANSLQALVYPFVDASVGRDPQVARNLHMGDYINLSVELELDLANPQVPTICVEDLQQQLPCDEVIGSVVDCLNDQSTCGDLPGNLLGTVCDTLNLPLCGGGRAQRSGGSGTDGGTQGGADGGAVPDDLGGLDLGGIDLGDLGLGRAPVGAGDTGAGASPLAGLGQEHDRVLVGVLGAPLVQGGAR